MARPSSSVGAMTSASESARIMRASASALRPSSTRRFGSKLTSTPASRARRAASMLASRIGSLSSSSMPGKCSAYAPARYARSRSCAAYRLPTVILIVAPPVGQVFEEGQADLPLGRDDHAAAIHARFHERVVHHAAERVHAHLAQKAAARAQQRRRARADARAAAGRLKHRAGRGDAAAILKRDQVHQQLSQRQDPARRIGGTNHCVCFHLLPGGAAPPFLSGCESSGMN